MKSFVEKYKKLMIFGKKVAAFQIRIMFTITYYIFILPYALFIRMFSAKPDTSGWKELNYSDSVKDAKRQF